MSDGAGNRPEGELYTYDAYGNMVTGNTTGQPFRYTGRRWDDETGLYYYRARYYSAELGRFLQTDPIGYEDNMNLYGYTGNDPVNRTDPFGLEAVCKENIDGQLACEEADKTPEEIKVTAKRVNCGVECQARNRTHLMLQAWIKQLQERRVKQCEEDLAPNGCGPQGGFKFPEQITPYINFSGPCNVHDSGPNGFGTLGTDFDTANKEFLGNMLNEVVKGTGKAGTLEGPLGATREASVGTIAALGYFAGVQLGGDGAFEAGQRRAAQCAAIDGGK